jgi:hypothetical protein
LRDARSSRGIGPARAARERSARYSEGQTRLFPVRCYVGQIEAVDDLGFRMTLVDWVIGQAMGYDLMVPWNSLEGAYVATNEHDVKAFGDYTGRWQDKINQAAKPAAAAFTRTAD